MAHAGGSLVQLSRGATGSDRFMNVVRRIIGALLILAALAAAGVGVWLCSYAYDAAPYIEDGADGPSATLDRFLFCLEQKDFEGAYDLLYNYSTLGLENTPEDPIARMYWDAQLAAWAFTAAERSEMHGTRMDKRVTVRSLDLDAIAADVGVRVQEILAEKVENAYLKSDVYDENGDYREEVAMDALYSATAEMLSDTAKYACTQECTLMLQFSEGRWLVEVSPAFISALTGGAVRG